MESKYNFSNNNNNSTDMSHIMKDNLTDGYSCSNSSYNGSIMAIFFLLIFILSLTGNGLLLCVLFRYEKLKHVTNLFILNLACSDLIFTITLPFWAVYHLHHWVFGVFVCHFVTAAYFVGTYSSVILLTALTVDRFATVVLHNWLSNSARRKRCAIGACVATWVISIGASFSDSINMSVEVDEEGFSTCEESTENSNGNLSYYLQVSLLFLLPFAIIVFCYAAILITVMQGSNRRKGRTVVMVFCIVMAFFICWGPYNMLLFSASLNESEDCLAKEWFDRAFYVCSLLAYSHCCMNPLLYMLSQKLRSHLVHLLHCDKVKWRNKKKNNTQITSNIIQNSAVASSDPCTVELQVR